MLLCYMRWIRNSLNAAVNCLEENIESHLQSDPISYMNFYFVGWDLGSAENGVSLKRAFQGCPHMRIKYQHAVNNFYFTHEQKRKMKLNYILYIFCFLNKTKEQRTKFLFLFISQMTRRSMAWTKTVETCFVLVSFFLTPH